MPLNLKNRWWPATTTQEAAPLLHTAEPPTAGTPAQAVLELREALRTAETDCAEPQRILAFLPLSQWMAKVQGKLAEHDGKPLTADAAQTHPASNRAHRHRGSPL